MLFEGWFMFIIILPYLGAFKKDRIPLRKAFFFSVEGLRHHLPVRTKTRQQPPSRQKIKIKNKKIGIKGQKKLKGPKRRKEKGKIQDHMQFLLDISPTSSGKQNK